MRAGTAVGKAVFRTVSLHPQVQVLPLRASMAVWTVCGPDSACERRPALGIQCGSGDPGRSGSSRWGDVSTDDFAQLNKMSELRVQMDSCAEWQSHPACREMVFAGWVCIESQASDSNCLPVKKTAGFLNFWRRPCRSAAVGVTNGTSLSRGVGRGPRYHSTNSLILTFGGLGDNRHSRSASA